MNLTEAIGMMSTGALLAIGGYFAYGQLVADPEGAPVQTVWQGAAPDAQSGPQSALRPDVNAVTADVPQGSRIGAPSDEQVSRNASDIAGFSTADRLQALASLSLEPASQPENQLTPEQQEAIHLFERAARDFNQSSSTDRSKAVRFANMAISGLHVKYFYTIAYPFEEIDVAQTMAQQEGFVLATICDAGAIRMLMQDFGFDYSYTFISKDSRMVGKVAGDIRSCV